MRIKLKGTSVLIGTTLVLDGQEVDAPKSDAIYLISLNLAEAVGSEVEVELKTTEEVKEQAEEAVAKMVTAKKPRK